MRKWRFIFPPIVVFIVAQLAWLSLVGIWIYWYISNYIIFKRVGVKLSPQMISKGINFTALIVGLILLAAILVGMYWIFIYLNKQLKMTKLYDNFIANVTHELKSPLASIQLHLETLSIRDVPPDKRNEFISLMLKDVTHLENLITTILQIPALEQRKIAYNFQPHVADETVRGLISEAIVQFKLPPGAIKIMGKAPCKCMIDRNALKMVFNNLIDNAIKYSTDQVQLVVKLGCLKKRFVIEFIDKGIGISQKDQKKVFKKFQRIYSPYSPNVKGTGLGLYLVKQIVKYHRGKVTVFSEGINRGTTFRIELPALLSSHKGK